MNEQFSANLLGYRRIGMLRESVHCTSFHFLPLCVCVIGVCAGICGIYSSLLFFDRCRVYTTVQFSNTISGNIAQK